MFAGRGAGAENSCLGQPGQPVREDVGRDIGADPEVIEPANPGKRANQDLDPPFISEHIQAFAEIAKAGAGRRAADDRAPVEALLDWLLRKVRPADFGANVARRDHLTAGGAAHLRVAMAAAKLFDHDGRHGGGIPVPLPADHLHHDIVEGAAHIGEPVFVPQRPYAVGEADHEALFFKCPQPHCCQTAGNAGAAGEFRKTLIAQKRRDDQREQPAVADDIGTLAHGHEHGI